MKKVISFIGVVIIILSLSIVAYASSTNVEFLSFYGRRFENNNGQIESYEQSEIVEGRNFSLAIEGNSACLSLIIDNKQLQFDLLLLPSQFAIYTGNTVIGVCDETTSECKIVSFRIEQNALEIGLMEENIDLVDKTVLFLAIEDTIKREINYFQIPLSINFPLVYNTVNSRYIDTDYSAAEIEKKEVSYLTLSNRASDEDTFVSTITTISESDLSNNAENIDSSDELVDAIKDIKDASQYGFVQLSNSKSKSSELINGIPDDVYKSGAIGVWKKEWSGWDKKTGYAVYPMYYAGTSNRIHYVMTYSISKDSDFSNQEFDIGFKITENCWVLYLVEDDEVAIYDSRARVAVDPQITCISNTERGVFTRRYYTIVKADTLIDRASKIIIGYIPYLGDVATIYETLTSNDDLTQNHVYPYGDNFEQQEDEKKIIQEVSVCAEGLKQIDDYLYLKLCGDSISSVNYSFSYTIYDPIII